MNHKAYSILFCALFASTFVHEIRAKAADKPSFLARIQERSTDPETCELICNFTFERPAGLNITANINGSIIYAVNGSVAIGVDINAHIVAVFNGANGDAVAIDLRTGTGVYIKAVWIISKQSFQEYVTSVSSLSYLLTVSGAIKFTISSVSSEVLKVITGIVASLIFNINIELQGNSKLALQLVITYGKNIITLLNGSLKGFLKIVGQNLTAFKYDLAQFLAFLKGLGVIFSKLQGGFIGFIEAGGVIDIKALANAGSGLAIIAVLILAAKASADLEKALGSILNNVELFFDLVAQLGGYSNFGLDGLFKVTGKVISFINGKARLEIVIVTLIQFLAFKGQISTEQLSETFNATLSVVIDALEKTGYTQSFSELIVTIKALLLGSLTIKGVIISEIIKTLISGADKTGKNLLQVLVTVLIQLKSVVSVAVSLPTCIFVFILNLNSAFGIQLLRLLGISITISIGGLSGGILSAILKSVPNLISLLLGNFYDALAGLPVIGTVIKALNEAVTAASNGTISLKSLFNDSTVIQGLIKALFQWSSGSYLGASSNKTATAQAYQQTVTSTDVYYGITIDSHSSTSS